MKNSAPKFFLSLFLGLAACSSTPDSRSGTGTSTTSSNLSKKPESSSDSKPRLVILYLADIHGRLRPDQGGLGGYARLRGFVDREKAAAGSKTDVVVAAGGDLTD